MTRLPLLYAGLITLIVIVVLAVLLWQAWYVRRMEARVHHQAALVEAIREELSHVVEQMRRMRDLPVKAERLRAIRRRSQTAESTTEEPSGPEGSTRDPDEPPP
jgi:predicted Holliday junction resolvase-like endonuclease